MAFHLSWAIEGTFEVIWRVRQGGLRYVEVLRVDQGWLHVQPIDSDGSDTSEPIWVSPAAVDVLRPFTPQKPQRPAKRVKRASRLARRDGPMS